MKFGWLRILLCGVLHCGVLIVEARAENSLFIDFGAELTFSPIRAAFLVRFDDRPAQELSAVILPPRRNESQARITTRWYAGTKVAVPEGAVVIRYETLFWGATGQLAYFPAEEESVTNSRFHHGDRDALRTYLLQRKEVASGWRSQLKSQDDTLRRLRSDAELIGDFGKILDTKEEAARAQEALQSLEHDIANLQRFLRLAKTAAKPANQVGREAQLVKQLAELAAVSKRVEGEEGRRRNQGDVAIQKRMALIEATRLDDINELEAQLERLIVARAKLEKRRSSAIP